MIHPNDLELLQNLLHTSDIPAPIEAEYEIWRRMYHGCGASGALLGQLLVPMLRHCGWQPENIPPPEQVDWRKHIGQNVVAQYGDQKMLGTLVGLAPQGRLAVTLDDKPGEMEFPRHCVQLDI